MTDSRPPGYSPPSAEVELVRVTGDGATRERAVVAEEVPVALAYNGRSYAVMMCTPADLLDFAIGFSLSEQVAGAPDEIERVEIVRHARGIELQMSAAPAVSARIAERSRNIAGRTGCGLCGIEAIDDALRIVPPVISGMKLSRGALWRAGEALGERQTLNAETRAVHAAAWADTSGALHVVREDVGRHNALDKVIGALVRQRVEASDGFIVVTSRASYEMVQKTAIAGVPLLAAVSRPTGLAIRVALATGVTLVALLRGDSANVYAHPQRITE